MTTITVAIVTMIATITTIAVSAISTVIAVNCYDYHYGFQGLGFGAFSRLFGVRFYSSSGVRVFWV